VRASLLDRGLARLVAPTGNIGELGCASTPAFPALDRPTSHRNAAQCTKLDAARKFNPREPDQQHWEACLGFGNIATKLRHAFSFWLPSN